MADDGEMLGIDLRVGFEVIGDAADAPSPSADGTPLAVFPDSVRTILADCGTKSFFPAVGVVGFDVAVVAGGSADPLTGLTFGAEIRRVPLRTEAITLLVKPLPPNAPASFSGGVGIFNMNSVINRTEVTTDDALTLRLTLTGDGDMKRVRPPQLNLGEAFEVYDPKVIAEEAKRMKKKSYRPPSQ